MIRSNLNLYEEAGKIEKDFFALTDPFTVQDTNFLTGVDINCYPWQLPNQIIMMSSAESVDTQLWDKYKLCFNKMLLGDTDYFVCDLDSDFSLHPFKRGKPFRPLVSKAEIENAYATNPFKAAREYGNKFDSSGGLDALVKRSVIEKYSMAYEPIFANPDNETRYIIAYDPSTKIDNAVVGVGELIHTEEKGWILKLVYMKNLIEILKSGEKAVIQKPEQVQFIKDLLLDFNGANVPEYQNIYKFIIDAGAGGGGFDIAQYLLKEWEGKDRRIHRGLIDKTDKYMQAREEDYPDASDVLLLCNFTKDKVSMYEATQSLINQGCVIFPKSVNIRGELEYESFDAEGNIKVTNVKVNHDELDALIQFDLAKEELIGMEKLKKDTKISFKTNHAKELQGMHDDRADVIAMMCYELSKLRIEDTLGIDKPKKDFSKLFSRKYNTYNPMGNNFVNPMGNIDYNNIFNN